MEKQGRIIIGRGQTEEVKWKGMEKGEGENYHLGGSVWGKWEKSMGVREWGNSRDKHGEVERGTRRSFRVGKC